MPFNVTDTVHHSRMYGLPKQVFIFLFIELKQRFYSVLFLHIIMVVCVVCPLFVPFQCYLLLVLCRPYGEQKYISIRFLQVQ